MVQSPSLSRLTPTVALESTIDMLDPRFKEESTVVAKDLGSSKLRSRLDCGVWFSVIGSARSQYRA